MVRLAIRKSAASRAKKPANRKTAPRAKASLEQPAHRVKIAGFTKQANAHLQAMKKERGPTNRFCKSIDQALKQLNAECRRKNCITAKFATHLKKLSALYRKDKETPKALTSSQTQLQKFLSDHVKKNSTQLIQQCKKELARCEKEFSHLEKSLKQEAKGAAKKKVQHTVSPQIQRRLAAQVNQFRAFKTRWNKLLTQMSSSSPAPLKRSIVSLKKQLEQQMNAMRRCATLTSRYGSARQKKKGFTQKPIFSFPKLQSLERSVQGMKKEWDSCLANAKATVEQLKAAKQL